MIFNKSFFFEFDIISSLFDNKMIEPRSILLEKYPRGYGFDIPKLKVLL